MGHSDVERTTSKTDDRRVALRVVYETMALVAEYNGVDFPMFSNFWEVETTDLSATGMGFWSRRRPETELLLLMLGNPQASPIFIVSRVIYCSQPNPGDGRFRVGCEMMERLAR